MPRDDYRTCRRCGRAGKKAGPLSCTRLCKRCAKELVAENLDGVMGKTGPAHRRYRRAVAAGVGGVLLDDLPAELRQAVTDVVFAAGRPLDDQRGRV
jgi:hypothetical protein